MNKQGQIVFPTYFLLNGADNIFKWKMSEWTIICLMQLFGKFAFNIMWCEC